MKQQLQQIVSLEWARHETDAFLRDLIERRIIDADAISEEYGNLWRSIEMLVNAGGKRLRPYMVALSYSALSDISDPNRVIPAMVSQELFHQAILIHDDIIDRDTIRYGVKNIIGQYDDRYAPLIADDAERRHFSNSAAIIAGDLLISTAFQVLGQTRVQPKSLSLASETFAEGIFRVSGGELLDTETSFHVETSADALKIALNKTAYYSFIVPLIIGAQLAEASLETVNALRGFGEKLGCAFQLQDDLLGVFGDSNETGKSTSNDIREGKRTYLIERFEAIASPEQVSQFTSIFHNASANDEDMNLARQLIVQSGAKDAVEAEINILKNEALSSLDVIVLSTDARDAFDQLTERATKRNR